MYSSNTWYLGTSCTVQLCKILTAECCWVGTGRGIGSQARTHPADKRARHKWNLSTRAYTRTPPSQVYRQHRSHTDTPGCNSARNGLPRSSPSTVMESKGKCITNKGEWAQLRWHRNEKYAQNRYFWNFFFDFSPIKLLNSFLCFLCNLNTFIGCTCTKDGKIMFYFRNCQYFIGRYLAVSTDYRDSKLFKFK